jgi:hypothetical protein
MDDSTATATAAALANAASSEKTSVQLAVLGEKVNNIQTNVKEIKDTLKDALSDIATNYVSRPLFDEHINDDEKVHLDMETRVRVLEEIKWKQAGIIGLITGTISIVGVYLLEYFVNKHV